MMILPKIKERRDYMSFIRVVMGISMLFALQTILMVSWDVLMTFVCKIQKRDYTWKSASLFQKASSWSASLLQLVLYFIGMCGIIRLLAGNF
jgi:hypothetical protein